MAVPGDWNTQGDKLFFYEGSIWYKKDFAYNKKSGKRLFLYFGAVNYLTNVYLNGEPLGTHEGGFTPFHFDITDKVKDGDNFVVLRVNNVRKPENVPTVNFDWWNYGGTMTLLVETPEIFVDDYLLQLPKGKYNEIGGYVKLNKPQAGVAVTLRIPELNVNRPLLTDKEGRAFSCKVKPDCGPRKSKTLYCGNSNRRRNYKGQSVFVKLRPKGKIFVERQKTLRGTSIHEEAPRQGRIYSKKNQKYCLMGKRTGNFVRLSIIPITNIWYAAEEMD